MILLALASPIGAGEPGSNIIVMMMMKMFELDPEVTQIEVLSNQLEGRQITEQALSIRPLTQKEPVGLFTVLATLSKDGEEVATGQVRMRIRKFATVLVAADRIKRGEIIRAEQVLIERKEVTNLIEQPLESFEETAGFRVKRNLQRGTIITTGALEAIPEVERGEQTLIIYNDGLCRVTAPGEALQSGSTGDYIKVRNKATRKIIVARVAEDGAVEVDP